MAKNLDYSLQLPDIAAPQQSRAGELLISAGASEGRAAATAGQNAAGALSFLGTNAVGAYKGKLEADLTNDINDATSKLEGFGETALRSQQSLVNVQDDIASFADNPPDDPAHIKAFGDETSKFIIAERQGILSRGEVVNRISAAVKKYSAEMPGWASDFRRIGAEMTGISHADAYPLHQALSKQSAAEKMAEKQMTAQLELDKDIAAKNGVALNQITPQMRAFHYTTQQLNLAADRAKNQMSLTTLSREEADRGWGQIHAMQVGAAATELASDFAKLGALHRDPTKAAESAEFGLLLSTKIGMLTATMERNITEMSRPQAGVTPISDDHRIKLMNEWRAISNNWQSAAKEIEGRNFLASAVKAAENNVSLLTSNFKIANPHLTVLNSYGSVGEIVKAWFAIGNKEEFSKRFPGLGDAVEKVMTAPQYHANAMGQVFGGQGVNLAQVAQVSPELATVVAGDMVASIKEWSKIPNPDDRKKQVFANTFGAFYSNPSNFVASVPRNLEAAYSTLSNPDTQRFFSQLSTKQRTDALLPMVGNIERSSFEVGQQIRAELAKWNDTDTNTAARNGVTLELKRNNLTGAFEIVENRVAVPPSFVSNAGGAATGFAGGGATSPRIDAGAARARANTLVNTLNRQLETYTLGVRSLGLENATTTLGIVQEMADLSLRNGVQQPLTPGLAAPRGADTPKAPAAPSGLDLERAADATKVAENSGSTAISPKGAKGRYQFMEPTAKQYGLKIDPKAGIDERTDDVKSRKAAQGYLSKLAEMFKGDLAKVAASYNAGEGNVQAAAQKAEELGVPEMWQAFLPKPKETVPYVKKWLAAYQPSK